MTPEQYEQISALYHAALALKPSLRGAFLDQACRGDEQMRQEVENLLASNEQAGGFLSFPAVKFDVNQFAAGYKQILPGDQVGHYRIQLHIGAGGMGEVYLAMDEKLGRKVALKILPAEFAANPERLRRFIREAKAASATDHPNIVTIHEIGESDGVHFIAEEFVEGETLRSRIERGAMPLSEALDIARQTAEALAAAHNAGIIHRDIKPENIMLRPDGYVKVLDFGLAAINQPARPNFMSNSEIATIPAETTPGTILGTVNYMSPEQTRGQKADARSDLWSLGVVLYEMLTGQKPFQGESVPDTFVAILDREPLPLSQSISNPPAEFEQILRQLLAKQREDRYLSAMQLAADLKKLHYRFELDAERAASEHSYQAYQATQVNLPVAVTESRTAVSTESERQSLRPDTSQVSAEPVNRELATVARLSRATVVLVVFLAAGMIAVVSWILLQQKRLPANSRVVTEPAPERSFTYSLTVQEADDSRPFQSSGRERYRGGAKFRFNFTGQQSGYLYLLNEGPTKGGGIAYTILFPTPSTDAGQAKPAAGNQVQTDWLVFDQHPGTEKFWIVWAINPVPVLEAVKVFANPADKGLIAATAERDSVRALLSQYEPSKVVIKEDKVNEQTNVRGRGEILLGLVELKHR